MNEWWIYKGTGKPHHDIDRFLERHSPPPWREFKGQVLDRKLEEETRGQTFQADTHVKELVNAAIYLRRPLLVTGKPGSGKSSLAYAIAYELGLKKVLLWAINTRSTLQEGLYRYDAIARLQEASLNKRNPAPEIGRFIQLGPLGTALLPSRRPRVLLIDEIDKSDIDLPNDLLNVFEEGSFEIPELMRLPPESKFDTVNVVPYDRGTAVPIVRGQVVCNAFPIVIMTSNNEREFPPAFLRRCIRLNMPQPDEKRLAQIVSAHLRPEAAQQAEKLIARFIALQKDIEKRDLATDQLLNAIYMRMQGIDLPETGTLAEALLMSLNRAG